MLAFVCSALLMNLLVAGADPKHRRLLGATSGVFMVKMGVTKEKLAKLVTQHPELLYYSVEDGLWPFVDYLRSIGLSREDIANVFD